MTCHTSLPRLNDPAGAELRGSASDSLDSKAFCMNCHREDGARTAAGAHWMAVSRAHPMKEEDRPAISHDGGVDRASRTCLSCHDGVSAADAGYETNLTRLRGFLGDKSRNHPIGVRYPQGGTQGVEVRLRPASLLPEAISLPGGYVSCNSCHNLYGTEAHRLSVPIEGSKLCLTCHDMD
jgi:predicted CXXCH cytochrome family protein